jgi:hypothetical protein
MCPLYKGEGRIVRFSYLVRMGCLVGEFASALAISQMNPYRAARRAIYCLIVCMALGHFLKLVVWAGTPLAVLRSDITQDYVMGRAVVNGINCRVPFHDLVSRFIGQDPGPIVRFPSPHSPLATFLFLPLSLLSPAVAHYVWVIVSALCGFWAFFVLGDLLRVKDRGSTALLWLSLSILSYPGGSDLFYGQWNFPQLLILALFVRSYERGESLRSAAYLSFAIAMRPILVPLCVYTLLISCRRFRVGFVLVSAALVVLLFATLGVDVMVSYPSTAQEVVGLWHGAWENLSLRSLVANLVLPSSGNHFHDSINRVLSALPPAIYGTVGTALVVGVGIASLARARGREPRHAMLSLVVISPVLSPIAWHHYMTMLFLPLFLDWARLLHHPGLRSRITLCALILPLVYPALAIFEWLTIDGFSEDPTAVQIPLLARSVFPVVTLSVVLAGALYPLPKRGQPEGAPKGGVFRFENV